MADVSITPCATYEAAQLRTALEAALSPIGGLDFVQPGMRIGIKMNLIAPKHYDSAATTHPAILRELTRLILERGASVIIGDSPGGPYSPVLLRSFYGTCGVTMAEKAGAALNYDTGILEKAYPQGSVLKKVTYTKWLQDCDAVISCAKLKTHGMLGMTGAVKNMLGIVPGLMKAEYHALYPEIQRFCDMLIDLNEFIRPQLAIIDGIVGMEGNGPTGGTPREMGCIIASPSGYRADVVMAHVMGLAPDSMPLIHAAAERGLSPRSIGEMDIAGDPELFRQEDYKNIPIGGVHFGGAPEGFLMRLVQRFLTRRPVVDKKLCVSCGVCKNICPQKVISIGRYPKIQYTACIRCFCCQEFCPKEAISVRQSFLV